MDIGTQDNFLEEKNVLCNLNQRSLAFEMPLGGLRTSSTACQQELLHTIHLFYQVHETCLFLTSFLCKEIANNLEA